MNLEAYSIKELKAMLATVERDLADIDNEHHIANDISKRFSGTVRPVEYHRRLKADIQIQLDILSFLQSGGSIQVSAHSGRLNSKAVRGAKAGKKLQRRFGVA